MRLARIAIFLTGMIGLAAGGLMTISTLKTTQDEALLKANEALKSQATLLVDQFFSILDPIRHQGPETNTANDPAYVLERGLVKMKDGLPSEFEAFSSKDPAFEELLLGTLKAQLSIQDLQLVKLGLGTFEIPESGGKSGIFVAIPELKNGAGALAPEFVDKVRITLIDPVKAFPGLQKLSMSDQSACLMSKTGKVLAHSIPAYVGTDLSKVAGLKDMIENLFLGAQTGSVQRYTQVDGNRQTMAVVRAGVLPFAFAVEQKVPPAVLSQEWFRDQTASGAARRNIGVAFILMAVALFLFAIASSWVARGVRKELERARGERAGDAGEATGTGAETSWVARGVAPSLASRAAEAFSESRNLLEDERSRKGDISRGFDAHRDHAGELLGKIERACSLETVERELVLSCSELASGNVAYFRYQRRIQNLELTSRTGGLLVEHEASTRIYVRKDIELQVEQLADSGKVASLTHYAPVKKMISVSFKGRPYEAWAVTTTSDVSGQAKLVGVLILIDPVIQNPMVRPVLAKLLKEAGNYLYAQGNKLQPKSRIAAPSRNPGRNADLTASPDPA